MESQKKLTCTYVFLKGKNKGTICGSKCLHHYGEALCRKHLKIDKEITKHVEPKKISPCIENNILFFKNNTFEKHKNTGIIYDPKTSFAFKSFDEPIIIGMIDLWNAGIGEETKWIGDGKLLPLDADEIRWCTKNALLVSN